MDQLEAVHGYREEKIRVSFAEALRILRPYSRERIVEQIKSVFPIVAYLFLFQLAVLRMPVAGATVISMGLLSVLIGLAFFMEGLRLGLMPFGETIGATLPQKSSLPVILGFALLLGIGATLAEPAIGILKSAGVNIDPKAAPLLYAMLTNYSALLVLAVAVGVGIAVVLGVLRFLNDWSLNLFIVPLVLLLTVLSVWAHLIPEMRTMISLAWDTGAVTTGPVTVPLVLSLGIGVCRITGKSDTGMAGFGVVTLASLLPIITVLALGFYLHYSAADLTPAEAATAGPATFWQSLMDSAVAQAVIASIQAILPLCLFLFAVQAYILREKISRADEIILGIGFALLGMILFNLGISIGMTPLGNQVGGTVPASFSQIEAGVPPRPLGPLYGDPWGTGIAIAFAFFLGYGATLAEPALNALGITVEEITVGAFKKNLLMQAVAFGVGVGIALGIVKIIFGIPLIYLLLPPYILLIFLSLKSTEEFVNIAWDSAGVTTGPVTVPLVIAMGLGVGNSIPGVIEGFGILSMASVCPILSVITLGLIVRRGPEPRKS
jgi:hypothetical protein